MSGKLCFMNCAFARFVIHVGLTVSLVFDFPLKIDCPKLTLLSKFQSSLFSVTQVLWNINSDSISNNIFLKISLFKCTLHTYSYKSQRRKIKFLFITPSHEE